MSSVVIDVDHVSMKFHINKNKVTSLKEWMVSRLKHQIQYEDFYALRDVSFTVHQGEIVGLVGRNGSGKSTLLKIISGIYKPTSGKSAAAGRIAPMLELGSGFDYELSGQENVFLNGSILGFDEAFLKSRYEEIVEFSELGDFIYQPLKTYSSGMIMRLAFAIATIIDPDILIVDEILAVGDEKFQVKSRKRMMDLMNGGTTVLMVSHNMEQVRSMCTHAVWLDHGTVRMKGQVAEVCDAYQSFLQQ